MQGLTNNQQAILMLASGTMIAISAVSVPLGVSPYITLSFGLIGAAGMAVKEWLGIEYPTPVPNPAPTPTPAQTAFSIANAKAAGYKVFANANEPSGYVLMIGGQYYDVTGKLLGSGVPAGTGAQV